MYEEPDYFRPHTKYRWSAQFGLYRYQADDGSYKQILSNRRNIRYFAVLAMFGFVIIMICLLIYDSSTENPNDLPDLPNDTDFAIERPILSQDSENQTNFRAQYNPITSVSPNTVNTIDQPSTMKSQLNTNATQSQNYSQPITAERFTQLKEPPIAYLTPPPVQEMSLYSEAADLNIGESMNPILLRRKVSPIYFDEMIENLSPPPKYIHSDETNTTEIIQPINRRTYHTMSVPNPFRYVNTGPKPQAFTPNALERKSKYPQVDNYRYPTQAMNIQDIIQYLTSNKNKQKTNDAAMKQSNTRITFSGQFRAPNTDLTDNDITANYVYNQNADKNTIKGDNGVLLTGEQYFYSDPFFNYKPSDPSDINLLAPNKFRFAPSLIHNHKFVPVKEENPIPKKVVRKKKPLSVMLDIYPMTNEGDDGSALNIKPAVKTAQKILNYRQAIPQMYTRLPMYGNPGNNYHNLNTLYHLGNFRYPNPPNTQNIQQNSNTMIHGGNIRNVYDVTGFQSYGTNPNEPTYTINTSQQRNKIPANRDQQKMVVHLNLYPRKNNNSKLRPQSGVDVTRKMETSDLEFASSNISIQTVQDLLKLNKTELINLNERFRKINSDNCNNKDVSDVSHIHNLNSDGHTETSNVDLYFSDTELTPNKVPQSTNNKPILLESFKNNVNNKEIIFHQDNQEHPKIYIFAPKPQIEHSAQTTSTTPPPSVYITPVPTQHHHVDNATEEYDLTAPGDDYEITYTEEYPSHGMPDSYEPGTQITDTDTEQGFVPMMYSDEHFRSLHKTFMTENANDFHTFNETQLSDTKPENIHYYQPEVVNYPSRKTDRIDTNSMPTKSERSTQIDWREEHLKLNPKLKNHKPYFTAINRTLINSSH